MSDPVIVFCETFTGPKFRHCYCADIEPEKCSNCLAKEALGHYQGVLTRLDRLREIVERIMTQHWDLASCRCWICERGRAAGCHPREGYPQSGTTEYGEVSVAQATEEVASDAKSKKY
jgi:hypothetical protein